MVLNLIRAWKGNDDRRIHPAQGPTVMDVSVAQDDEARHSEAGILAHLLLAYTRIFILRFRFQDDQRLAVVYSQQQKIDESLRAFLKSAPRLSMCSGFSMTFGSRTTFAGPLLSSKKRQPAASSSRLILILAVASLRSSNAHPPTKIQPSLRLRNKPHSKSEQSANLPKSFER